MDRITSKTFGKIEVTMREMTVQEVIDLLEGRLKPKQDAGMDAILTGNIASEVLSICTDAELSELRKLTPTQLQEVADSVAELNPFFVRLLENLTAGQARENSVQE